MLTITFSNWSYCVHRGNDRVVRVEAFDFCCKDLYVKYPNDDAMILLAQAYENEEGEFYWVTTDQSLRYTDIVVGTDWKPNEANWRTWVPA